jgi:hypothetical protein
MFITGFMDISWVAVLLHVRNHGIMSTTKTSKTLSGSDDFAVLLEKALNSRTPYYTDVSNQRERFELLKLRLSSHRNVSFAQR